MVVSSWLWNSGPAFYELPRGAQEFVTSLYVLCGFEEGVRLCGIPVGVASGVWGV